MDIQHLVDRLEDLIDEGRHMPFSKFTMIDEERALEIIDQMRISIPEEIEKAARVLAQRDRILAQANEEAARLVQQARERSEALIDREDMVQRAQQRADQILEQARLEAQGIMDDADNYVLAELSKLEQQLARAMNIVRNGINQVHQQMNGEGIPAPTTVPTPAAFAPASPPTPAQPAKPVTGPLSVPAPRPLVDVNNDGKK